MSSFWESRAYCAESIILSADNKYPDNYDIPVIVDGDSALRIFGDKTPCRFRPSVILAAIVKEENPTSRMLNVEEYFFMNWALEYRFARYMLEGKNKMAELLIKNHWRRIHHTVQRTAFMGGECGLAYFEEAIVDFYKLYLSGRVSKRMKFCRSRSLFYEESLSKSDYWVNRDSFVLRVVWRSLRDPKSLVGKLEMPDFHKQYLSHDFGYFSDD